MVRSKPMPGEVNLLGSGQFSHMSSAVVGSINIKMQVVQMIMS